MWRLCETIAIILLAHPTLQGDVSQDEARQGSSCEEEEIEPNTEPDEVCLLSSVSKLTKFHQAKQRTSTKSHVKNRGPFPAGAFDDFAEGESTYDRDGDGPVLYNGNSPHVGFLDGWQLGGRSLYDSGNQAAVFDETASANDKEAWQTHFPALRSSIVPSAGTVDVPTWHTDGWGQWVQDYRAADLTGSQRQENHQPTATWFDASMDQYDGYGRQRHPNPGSPRSLFSWTERAVNTTLVCADRGCTANTKLVAYDPATEQARNCRLSIPVHPTDFDDEYAGERLEFIHVNGHEVNTDCFPNAYACNAVEEIPMVNCLSNYPVDVLIDKKTGAMDISAKISDVVDECPYHGNLLAAVPTVTCLIQAIHSPPKHPVAAVPAPAPPPCLTESVTVAEPLRCDSRGCEAHTKLTLPNKTAVKIFDCDMTVTIRQTDFDMMHDDWEVVEYLNVSHTNMGTNYKPGKNPCSCGKPQAVEGEDSYVLLDKHNVTEEAQDGEVEVSAKISPLVDECAADGYLLNALAEMSCKMTCL